MIPEYGYSKLACLRCGLPNPKGRDPVRHQEINCAYCRNGGALKKKNTERTWEKGDPVKT